ncbi:MTRF1L release factor glutamine methyltransferase isoform X2 [Phascolarctos cinereus]|uniref:peptide chain release factor N(5)-glutamine methyltransferase n=1 Tax=Phascolarctos cinereus TaxID=38626 RepID=A0A6P5L9L2_PHACI|nr:hemK methyltransferase family member 1 isoform X2 [Phascolarctos cinereus]
MWLWRVKPWGLAPRGLKWKGGLLSPPVLLPLRPVSGCRAPSVTATALVNYWAQLFEERGVPEARESSEYIVAHVLGAKTFQSLLASQRSTSITDLQREQIGELCTQRLQRMPVQYIIGEWDFQGLTLKMAPPVFIPRPETEELVNLVLHEEFQRCQERRGRGTLDHQPHCSPVILDVCCGSGAIALSLLSRLTQSRVVAVDKGEEAVQLTRENAQRLHLENRIQIVHHDITSGVNREQLLPWGPVDFVVSNPPYIFHCDMEQLAPEILRSIFLEVDPRHPELVGNWLQSRPDLALSISATHVDFCGKPRFLHIHKSRSCQ